jgi:hypothetical protein
MLLSKNICSKYHITFDFFGSSTMPLFHLFNEAYLYTSSGLIIQFDRILAGIDNRQSKLDLAQYIALLVISLLFK